MIQILEQVCGSLFEAHSMGLVHRDIKPANIMLNRRGGEPDVVKVLDFGLVKALEDGQSSQESVGLSGTPLYMSPESIQSPDTVDGRSDLYAVGAVGYFLLTGQTVFQADSLDVLCKQHIAAIPETPSSRLGRPVSAGLESALMACLEKNRARRPQTARDLAKQLAASTATTNWTSDDADAWWGRHERELVHADLSQVDVGKPVRRSVTVTSAANKIIPSGDSRSSDSQPVGNANRITSSGFDQTIAPDNPPT